MANCNNLFDDFLKEISIPSLKRDKMLVSKNKLRERVRAHFKKHHPEYYPMFYIQGSYKMKTAIRIELDICDLDDGIYFFREPDVSATTLQGWIWDAVNGYTSTTPEHRKKCIRNIFAGDYEIDMPVYYKIDNKEYQLAVKNNEWEDSDPKSVVNWFSKKKDEDCKLVDSVKSLKAWCDYVPGKITTGLALSILAGNAIDKIVLNKRTDITLRDILREIKKALDTKFECIVPAAPFDDLFSEHDNANENKFKDALSDFLDDADAALKEDNPLAASKLWRTHLGQRFPLGEDKNENVKSSSRFASAASLSNPWADV